MNMTGVVLGGRYVVGDRLGGGGTAFVYKGRDSVLNRTVAIKVLSPQMTTDEDFVARFRREAQAAASLSNPHVVAIHDVGHDGDSHFIVMEYVQGRTLKEFIVDSGTLDGRTATEIAIQIADALRHAHQHGVIHRDIKPLNILITPSGKAKVTDFGIARAVSSATLTPTEAMMGSVHYLSPEQARGGFVNERSDIYSLGIVLYEMLSGEVPFTGDNAFSIGLKHLHDLPRPLSELVPDIDPRLEEVVMKCLRKEQDSRYQTAQALLEDLSLVAGTEILSPDEIVGAGKYPGKNGPSRENTANAANDSRRGDMGKRPKRKISWLALVSLLTLTAMIAMAAFLVNYFWPSPEVVVPDLVGKTLAEATALLRELNLSHNIHEAEPHPEIPPNVVLRQDPPSGSVVRARRTIEIVPSRGPDLLEVPDVTGMTLLEAEIELARAGFAIGQMTERTDDAVPLERIIEQNPRPGTLTQRGEQIDIAVSLGPPIVEVLTPLLVGLTEGQALTRLTEIGLTLAVPTTQEPHPTLPPGQVISQIPAPGERIVVGSAVAITVSRGRQVTTHVVIPADRMGERSRIEVIVDDREGTRFVYDRVHNRQDGELRIPVTGIAPFRLILRIDGMVESDEIVNTGGP